MPTSRLEKLLKKRLGMTRRIDTAVTRLVAARLSMTALFPSVWAMSKGAEVVCAFARLEEVEELAHK